MDMVVLVMIVVGEHCHWPACAPIEQLSFGQFGFSIYYSHTATLASVQASM